jgi:predicted aldo/keto reductase-like oxidoreductase
MKNQVFVKENKFKGIEKNPSLLGFGCMRFPTLYPGKPDIDEELAQKMIDYAYANGVTYYDTAYPYHRGMSETFIGKALKKYPRQSFFLASKMPGWLIHSKEDAERIFLEQLTKCQVEYFDFYLCHALGTEAFQAYRLPGVMDFLFRMKAEGKIRHLGFSFHDTPEVLVEIIHAFAWDFVQIQCNYLDWTFLNARKMYDIIEKYGVPCIVMEPVRGGLLASLCEESQSIFKAADPETSIASWAIRYVASKPNVMVVLSGMSNEEQTRDNIQTLSHFRPVTIADQKVISRALAVFLKSTMIPCTGCRYCLPCPHGVDIPLMFRFYNEFAISKHRRDFLEEYEGVLEDQRADRCVACGECMTHCPQKILIPEKLKEVSGLIVEIRKENEKKAV